MRLILRALKKLKYGKNTYKICLKMNIKFEGAEGDNLSQSESSGPHLDRSPTPAVDQLQEDYELQLAFQNSLTLKTVLPEVL